MWMIFTLCTPIEKCLVEMVPQIVSVLASIGLNLNPNKTRIMPVTQSINLF